MAILVTQKHLIIKQLIKPCSRCTRFVSLPCNAVYILFTVIILKPVIQYSLLGNVSKTTGDGLLRTNKQYEQITTAKQTNPTKLIRK